MVRTLPAPLTLPRTDVYYNLHRKTWSLKDRSTGKVYDHARVVVSALPVTLPVMPAGHARALQEKAKNVHAFVRGDWLEPCEDVESWQSTAATLAMVAISYNPFRGPTFYRKDTGEAVTEANAVIMIAPHNAAPWVGALL